ncbi:hypothetical protein [Blastococcus deserti]|uniref:Membrane protein DUF2207 n=1 Tax=Blastococcus deserti TaxID=2259033 RepID=A0ABW4XFM3_9ACTN
MQMILGWIMFIGIALPAVVDVEKPWFAPSLIVTLLVLGFFLPTISSKWIYKITYGRPVFGAYGGVPRHVLEAEVAAAADFSVDLPEDDEKDLKAQVGTSEAYIAAHTKNAYITVQRERTGRAPDEEEWAQYWKRVTTQPIARSTYQRALANHPLAFALVPGFLHRTALIAPLATIMLTTLVLLSPFAVSEWTLPPVMLSVAVLFALMVAVVSLTIANTRPGETIPLGFRPDFADRVDRLEHLSVQERSSLKGQAAALAGRTARVIDVRTGIRFKKSIARFTARQFVAVVTVNMVYLLGLMALCLLVATPFSEDVKSLALQYARQATLLTALSGVALIAYRFWELLISQLPEIIGPPVGAAVVAGIIPVGKYAATGHWEIDAVTIISTAAVASIGLFGTKLGELAKRPK